jgi:hypothetical protein
MLGADMFAGQLSRLLAGLIGRDGGQWRVRVGLVGGVDAGGDAVVQSQSPEANWGLSHPLELARPQLLTTVSPAIASFPSLPARFVALQSEYSPNNTPAPNTSAPSKTAFFLRPTVNGAGQSLAIVSPSAAGLPHTEAPRGGRRLVCTLFTLTSSLSF